MAALLLLDEDLFAVCRTDVLGGMRCDHGNGSCCSSLTHRFGCLAICGVCLGRAVGEEINDCWGRMTVRFVMHPCFPVRFDHTEIGVLENQLVHTRVALIGGLGCLRDRSG